MSFFKILYFYDSVFYYVSFCQMYSLLYWYDDVSLNTALFTINNFKIIFCMWSFTFISFSLSCDRLSSYPPFSLFMWIHLFITFAFISICEGKKNSNIIISSMVLFFFRSWLCPSCIYWNCSPYCFLFCSGRDLETRKQKEVSHEKNVHLNK